MEPIHTEEDEGVAPISVFGETSDNLLLAIPMDSGELSMSPQEIIVLTCSHMEEQDILCDPVYAQMELRDCNGYVLHPTTQVQSGAVLHMQSKKGPCDEKAEEDSQMVLINDELIMRVPYPKGTSKHTIKMYLERMLGVEHSMYSARLIRTVPHKCGQFGTHHFNFYCNLEETIPLTSIPPSERHVDDGAASVIYADFVDLGVKISLPYAMACASYCVKVAQELAKIGGDFVPECDPDEMIQRGETVKIRWKE
jgi:hypothetical protein